MFMIKTEYPYGSVNINAICSIQHIGDRYYFYDKCGRWRIDEQTYFYLEERGIPKYEREYSTTESL